MAAAPQSPDGADGTAGEGGTKLAAIGQGRGVQRLANHAYATLALRLLAAALNFVLGIAIARLVGVEGYASYNVMLAVANVATACALLGHDTLANRQIATASDPGAYLRAAARQVWVAAALATACAALLVHLPGLTQHAATGFVALLLLIPLTARTRLAEAALRGAHRASLAIVGDGVLRPAAILLACGAWAVAGTATAASGSAAVVVVVIVVAGLGTLLLNLRWEALSVPPRRSAAGAGQTLSLQLYAASLLSIATNQAPTLVAGLLPEPAAAGRYAAAERLAFATALIAQAVYLAIASRLAAAHAAGDRVGFERLAILQTRRVTLATVVVCALVAAGADPLLAWYGADFVAARPALLGLLLVPLVGAAAGPVGPALTMTGHERDYLAAMALSVIVQVAAYLLLVPVHGLDGIVAGVVAGTLVWNAAMAIQVQRRLGIGAPLLLRRLPRATA